MLEDSIILSTIRRNPGATSLELLESLMRIEGFDEFDTFTLISQTERLKKHKYLYGDWFSGFFATDKILAEC